MTLLLLMTTAAREKKKPRACGARGLKVLLVR